MEYAFIIWDPHTSCDSDKLEKNQRTQTDPVFKPRISAPMPSDNIGNQTTRRYFHEVPTTLVQLVVWLQRPGCTGHVLYHNDLTVHDVLCGFHKPIQRTRISSNSGGRLIGWWCQSHLQLHQWVKTAHCDWIETNSTTQVQHSLDKMAILVASSKSSEPTMPSHVCPPTGTKKCRNTWAATALGRSAHYKGLKWSEKC